MGLYLDLLVTLKLALCGAPEASIMAGMMDCKDCGAVL